MELIPVIDLKEGLAVHARKGARDLYRPAIGFGDGKGTPLATLEAYLALAPFRTIYIADLDALAGNNPQWDLIESLAENFPQLRFWVDAGGEKCPSDRRGQLIRIVGSESLPDGLPTKLPVNEILSLDFRSDHFLGSGGILNQPEKWPDRIILMNLSVVGSMEGPDFSRLRAFREHHPERRVFAAGGVRHQADLEQLAALKLSGVLLATVLQQGGLSAECLRRWVQSSDSRA